jgi:hypothetical protein
MAKKSKSEQDSPVYIRWTPDTCPYALEMRLSLITRVSEELQLAESVGGEIGGVFVGALPTPNAPTLRLDDLLYVFRGAASDRVTGEFKANAAQLRRLAEVNAEAGMSGQEVVGFVRSHLRAGPLAPSTADIALLTEQFPGGTFAVLIIGAAVERAAPREATFFLSLNGTLPETPSTPVFPFDESAFKSLPEVAAEAVEEPAYIDLATPSPARKLPWPAILMLAFLVYLIATWAFGKRIAQQLRPDSNKVALTVIADGSNLKITWDHSAPVLSKAQGANVVITDGPARRELDLDPDELRLGQIAYERLTGRVKVEMMLEPVDAGIPPQTVDWPGSN